MHGRILVASLLVVLAGCSCARMHGSEAGPAIDPPARAEPTLTPVKASESAPPTGSTQPGAKAKKQEGATVVARHVLIQWMGADRAGKSVVRTREQARQLAEEVARRAKSGEDMGRLAVEYSDEPGAASRGGSLGRFGRGQMVRQFDAVVFALKPGEISDVVETGFGYHIIQRLE
jgi:hypothetical protein